MDAYRLSDVREAEDLDLDTMTNKGPLVIEWAERIQEVLPAERIWIQFHYVNNDQRDLVIKPYGARYQLLVTNLQKQVYGVH